MGLPGSGKTTLAKQLALKIGAVHFNADEVREHINKDLGFSYTDRIEQARRMGYLCDIVNRCGKDAIADFVCPLTECRRVFHADFTIYLHTIVECRFPDTQRMFMIPIAPDVVFNSLESINLEQILAHPKLNLLEYAI